MKKLLALWVTFLLCCSHTYTKDQETVRINLFIHGSFSLRPHLSIRNIVNMLFDTVEESVYYRTTEISRRDSFFHKNQAMLGLGLRKIDIKNPTTTEAAPVVAGIYEKIAQIAGESPSDQYYAFGWSGLVSHKLRYMEASLLHSKLLDLIKKIEKEGKKPFVRIISYSHGGNLALQLGAIHVTKPPSEQFDIDELFLLGTPVQVETDYLINSPIFKKIYNVYSKADRIQQLDFFSFKRFFSRRKFTNRRNFSLPDKLTQLRISVHEYTPKKDLSTIPFPRDEKALKKHFKRIVYDPGHFELWFMGWTILTYREDFPFNPLPIAAMLPMIVKQINQYTQDYKDLIIQLHPYKESMKIYDRTIKKKNIIAEKDFLLKKDLQDLKKYALTYEPADYNIKTYNRKMYDALQTARYEHNELKKLKKQISRKARFKKRKKIPTDKKRHIINVHKKNDTPLKVFNI